MKRSGLIFFLLLLICTSCQKKKGDWFTVEKLDNKTYRIRENQSSQGNSSYLIIGDKEALLFDSGSGENKTGDIKLLVDSLAGEPVTLLHSHFHFDHIGNSKAFPDVALPNLPDLQDRLGEDSCIHIREQESLIPQTCILKIRKQYPINTEFNLGNRKISIYHTPGHSPWSFTIVDKRGKYLFVGDLAYKGLLLVNDLDEYQNSLSQLIQTCDSSYQILAAHGNEDLLYSDLDKIRLALKAFQNKRPAPKKEINLLGNRKKMYVIDGIPFIYDETGNYLK